MSNLIHYRLVAPRRHAAELVAGVGVAAGRERPRWQSICSGSMRWVPLEFGIATLPRWLERIGAREFDAASEGKVMTERNGTAVLDGQNGLPPLVLERAMALPPKSAARPVSAWSGLARWGRWAPRRV